MPMRALHIADIFFYLIKRHETNTHTPTIKQIIIYFYEINIKVRAEHTPLIISIEH